MLKDFLEHLNDLTTESSNPMLGGNSRFQSLAGAIAATVTQAGPLLSVLMDAASAAFTEPLEERTPEARRRLLDALAELCRIVQLHQRVGVADLLGW
jgi:hypothetical protein